MTNICSCHIPSTRVQELKNGHGRPGRLALHSHSVSELVQAVAYYFAREDGVPDHAEMQDILLYSLIDGWHSLYNPDEDAEHVTRCAEIIDQCFFGGTLTFCRHLDITILETDSPFPASATVLVPQSGQTTTTSSVARITLNPQTFIAHGTSMRCLTFAEVIEQLIVHMAHAYLLLFSGQRGGGWRQRLRSATRENTVQRSMAVRRVFVHIFETIQDWNPMLEDFGCAYIDGLDE
ncbi:hypothetical protein ACRALDRAFT_2027271 [Sodiomyces alcalophilus JCM 7366]|uniref:uncharacterized protein n=1 Tax=Sodiomyces alcalophilus JCM 7366 TaxID=591952 RepID=UPI0039B6C95E